MIKKEITEFANSLGIEVFGFSENSFVALFPYYKKEEGNVSLYARSLDYHLVIKNKLEFVREKLLSCGAGKTLIHCDNGEFDDRCAAYEAGLGFYGRNNLLINDKYGSYFFIGQVIHDLDIERDFPLEKKCFGCNKCVDNCVTGTLKEGYEKINCLSDITQRKGELTEEEKAYLKKGGLCWGCDVCQNVCPHNENLSDTAIPEFLNERITSLKLEDVEEISEREFKRRYKKYAFSWRGGKVLKRNLEILREFNEKK